MNPYERLLVGTGSLSLRERVRLLRHMRRLAALPAAERADYASPFRGWNPASMRWAVARLAIINPALLFVGLPAAVLAWVVMVLVMVVRTVPGAHAQPAPAPAPVPAASSSLILDIDGVLSQLMTAVAAVPKQVVQNTVGLSGNLVAEGTALLGFALVGAVTVAGYRSLVLNKGLEEFFGDVLRAVVFASLALVMLQSWTSIATIIPSYMSGKVGGALFGGGGDPTQVLGRLLDGMGGVVRAMEDWIFRDSPPKGQHEGAVFSVLKSIWDSLTLQAIIKGVWVLLVKFIFFGIVGTAFLAFAAVMLVVVFGTQMVLGIGMIFGPIMIAWLPFQPMAWLAFNWLRYMITTALTLVIAYLIAGILATSMEPAVQTITNQASNIAAGAGLLIAALLMGVVMLFGAWMLMKADDIAQALVGGGVANAGGAFAVGFARTVQRLPRAAPSPKPSAKDGRSTPAAGAPAQGAAASQRAAAVNAP